MQRTHWHTYVHRFVPMATSRACVRSTVWLTIKITVATGVVKSSAPVAIVIGPAWQRLNIAMDGLTASARCYCDICVKINMVCLHFTSLHKKIISTESSPPDPPSTHSSVLVGMRTCTCRRVHTHHAASARRMVEQESVRHLR
jgi:hypothetical protein